MSSIALENVKHYDYGYHKDICYSVKEKDPEFDQDDFTVKLRGVKDQMSKILKKQANFDTLEEKKEYVSKNIHELKSKYESDNPNTLLNINFHTNKMLFNDSSDSITLYTFEAYYNPYIDQEGDVLDYHACYSESVYVDDHLDLIT